MQVTADIVMVREAVAAARRDGRTIGCVPTMGALHAGHMSLVDEARQRTNYVAVTIFVNPTQFSPSEDLDQYPRPLDDDLKKCRDAGVDLVFTPDVPDLYPPGYQTYVTVEEVSQPLEGQRRPTHFRGVATIVLKLFHILQPDVACFGQKDFQQQALIRRMVEDLHVPVDIVVCPTMREADGLAMSSRNTYLSLTERESALVLSESLELAQTMIHGGEQDMTRVAAAMHKLMNDRAGVSVDYATIADPDSLEELSHFQQRMVALVAARVGTTRLIDNRLIAISTR